MGKLQLFKKRNRKFVKRQTAAAFLSGKEQPGVTEIKDLFLGMCGKMKALHGPKAYKWMYVSGVESKQFYEQ